MRDQIFESHRIGNARRRKRDLGVWLHERERERNKSEREKERVREERGMRERSLKAIVRETNLTEVKCEGNQGQGGSLAHPTPALAPTFS